jgi:hypothetical protein
MAHAPLKMAGVVDARQARRRVRAGRKDEAAAALEIITEGAWSNLE